MEKLRLARDAAEYHKVKRPNEQGQVAGTQTKETLSENQSPPPGELAYLVCHPIRRCDFN